MQDIQPKTEEALKHVGDISTFIAKNSQQKGLGKVLSRASFQKPRSKGFRKIRAQVRQDNPRAIAFYQSQGFVIIGVAKQHALIRGSYVDQVLLERFLV